MSKTIKITDTSLRDAQQSRFSRHFDLDEIALFLDDLDKCNFEFLEVFGGATFEGDLKFWHENPWKRLSFISKNIKKTPLQMSIRGKNLVGYRPFSDEIIEKFLKTSFNFGISSLKIFDPLNDIDNIKTIIKIAKDNNILVQGVICYTIAPGYDINFYLEYAKKLAIEGVDGISIKDPAGILLPDVLIDLIKVFKENIKLPIRLHSHITNNIASLTYYEAIKHGIDGLDCTFYPMSFPASQPAIENIIKIFESDLKEHKINFDLNIDNTLELSKKIMNICSKQNMEKISLPLNLQDCFKYQLTRGSFNFLYDQLKNKNMLNSLQEILEETYKIREDLGFPPMITPISQLIIAQAIYNIILGEKYKLIPKEIKEFIKGRYGNTINPINQELTDKILKEKTIINDNFRKNNVDELYFEKIKQIVPDDLVVDETDYLTYAIFPELAMDLFRYRKNPDSFKNGNIKTNRATTPEEDIVIINRLMEEKNISEFELKEGNTCVFIKHSSDEDLLLETKNRYVFSQNVFSKEKVKKEKIVEEKEEIIPKDTIKSPIQGVFYSKPSPDLEPFVNIDDIIDEGTTICIIESMKVMNEIKSHCRCKIKKILVKDKSSIDQNQDLFVIEKI